MSMPGGRSISMSGVAGGGAGGGGGTKMAGVKASRCIERYVAVMNMLLKAEAYIDPLDKHCATPLMYASALGLEDGIIPLLLSNGAGVEALDLRNNTALHYAYAFKQSSAAELLKDSGADDMLMNADNKTPLEVSGLKNRIMPKSSGSGGGEQPAETEN